MKGAGRCCKLFSVVHHRLFGRTCGFIPYYYADKMQINMKKMALLASISALVFSLGSCKKDYSCKCTYGSGASASSYSSTLANMKKKDASAACKAKGGTSSVSGVTVTINCALD